MKKANGTARNGAAKAPGGIERISVAGYKSIAKEQSIEIRPLTILAGANSSGKSSIMQPLLLMKQTLEAFFDPGALLLDGPLIKFTEVNQFLSRGSGKRRASELFVALRLVDGRAIAQRFQRDPRKTLEASSTTYEASDGSTYELHPGMSHKEIVAAMPELTRYRVAGQNVSELRLSVMRDRCFLTLGDAVGGLRFTSGRINDMADAINRSILEVIHVPGLRGMRERAYPNSTIDFSRESPWMFAGPFEPYTATTILHWQEKREHTRLAYLFRDLKKLGLGARLVARRLHAGAVELLVSESDGEDASDLPNVVDVGLGVSMTAPALVALHAAKRGQLVYIEQPELHLHPRAQVAMGEVLAGAARRGVRVVVETHSEPLLLGIQTLVAEEKLSPDLVKLHWFGRDKHGVTRAKSADVDEFGAFGDWPEDFGEVNLDAQRAYLDAGDKKRWERTREKKASAAGH